MSSTDLEGRIAAIESRLTRIEARFGPPAPAMPPQAVPAPASPPPPKPAAAPAAPAREPGPSLATSVLGWGGGIALVLAAAYLIRLGVDSGWLTPVRQVALASIAGLTLIVAGFALRGLDRQYAGLLPAAGVAILFLSVYGAHLYYGFIGAKAAATAVVAICVVSLWLCRTFESDLYALFAVVGSYSAPFLLSGLRGSITDLVVYFSAWSAVFSVFAIWHGRRLIYLLALYLALPGFDLIWRQSASSEWVAALAFQAAQFAIFGIATAVFSIRHDAPLDKGAAFAHLPPLLLFYFLQYGLLSKHLPAYAPWIAVASAASIALIYAGARAALQRPLPGGELILWSYLALVLFHAGYIEMVPRHWAPWVAYLLVPALAVVSLRRGGGVGGSWPLWVAVGLIFGVNYLRVIFDTDVQGVPARSLLAIAYALLLYVGYLLSRGNLGNVAVLVLYAGHVSAMAAALHLLDQRIVQSVAWGVLALACLGLSLMQRDRALGQSSLLVFGATAAKVLLYDLSGAPPVARIVSLAVLGVTFYAGGMLYQRMLVAKQP
jgi:hypothetical protein